MVVRQILIILTLSTIISLTLNLFLPNRIDYIGQYRMLSNGSDPIIPPSAQKGDPPFIAIDNAELEFKTDGSLFIDCREPEEFECGTIPGSINIPFEHLPDGDLEVYFDSVLNGVPENQPLITYCSGEECDLSLHLARNLQDFGYERISIFFGGWREWKNLGLPIERKKVCEE